MTNLTKLTKDKLLLEYTKYVVTPDENGKRDDANLDIYFTEILHRLTLAENAVMYEGAIELLARSAQTIDDACSALEKCLTWIEQDKNKQGFIKTRQEIIEAREVSIDIYGYLERNKPAESGRRRTMSNQCMNCGRIINRSASVTSLCRHCEMTQIQVVTYEEDNPAIIHEIRALVNQYLADALVINESSDNKRFCYDPVNWADLSCIEVRRYESTSGCKGYEVIIEEAAPDAGKLQEYIRDRLRADGIIDTEVRTEW